LHIPVPDLTVWLVIAVEILGGLAIILGFKTRWAAAVLAVYCLATGFGVHLPVGDQPNLIDFYKNLAMAGGFLYVIAFGAGAVSIDKDG
jgi:putative oxidoreductase